MDTWHLLSIGVIAGLLFRVYQLSSRKSVLSRSQVRKLTRGTHLDESTRVIIEHARQQLLDSKPIHFSIRAGLPPKLLTELFECIDDIYKAMGGQELRFTGFITGKPFDEAEEQSHKPT